MIDIVMPNNNEKEFIAMAKKLGYTGLIFVYDKPQKIEIKSDFLIYPGILCKNKIKNADFVLLNSNKRNLLKKKPNAIYGIEGKKDFIHQKDSGLDQVICKEMNQHNISYFIAFSNILNSENRAGLLGRIMQNIRLCQKYNVSIMIASLAREPFEMRNPHDLIAFTRTLGVKKPVSLNIKNIKT